MAITSFTGAYKWLSNFSVVEGGIRILDGFIYPTVEHAYQAAKFEDLKKREAIFLEPDPAKAKRKGKGKGIRADWDKMKLIIMNGLIRQKFAVPDLRDKLLATGYEALIEGNWWGDKFWGTCNGEGENHLGKILMEVRDELRKGD